MTIAESDAVLRAFDEWWGGKIADPATKFIRGDLREHLVDAIHIEVLREECYAKDTEGKHA